MADMHKRSNLQVQGFLRGIDTAYARVEQKGEQMSPGQAQALALGAAASSAAITSGRWSSSATWRRCLREAITKRMEHALSLLESELKNVWTVLLRVAPGELRDR